LTRNGRGARPGIGGMVSSMHPKPLACSQEGPEFTPLEDHLIYPLVTDGHGECSDEGLAGRDLRDLPVSGGV